jgi:hypothetical protein
MATGDAIYSAGTQTTVITGGATRATGAFSTSGEVTALSSNTYPIGDAVLSCSFSVAPTEGDRVHLYRRDINIDSTNDATAPEAGYEHIYLGSFPVKDVTSQQYIPLPGIPLAYGDQEFYIENDADQTMDADYTVKITPLTYKASA